MTKYRKKPVVIDAEVYKLGMEDGFEEWCAWYEEQIPAHTKDFCGACRSVDCQGQYLVKRPYINTLEGKHYISPGDYIITDVEGERYPIKPHIFKIAYEKVGIMTNFEKWKESLVPKDFISTGIFSADCPYCPAKKFCNSDLDNEENCEDTFLKWAGGSAEK